MPLTLPLRGPLPLPVSTGRGASGSFSLAPLASACGERGGVRPSARRRPCAIWDENDHHWAPSPASLRSAPSPALRERGDPAHRAGWVRATLSMGYASHFHGKVPLAATLLITVAAAAWPASADGPIADWRSYGGDAGGSRYSPLTQIGKSNVAELKVAWEYHTGDVSDGSGGRRKSAFETTAIVADGTMYLTTPFNRVVALDPETGREKWRFDPQIDLQAPYSEGLINRGVTLWTDPGRAQGDPCRQRIFLA